MATYFYRLRRFSARLGIAACLLSQSLGEAHFASAQVKQPLRPERDTGEVLAAFPPASQMLLSPDPLSSSETVPPESTQSLAGRVAFQSYRDGNWEIYFGTDEFSSVYRLTADPAADVEPSLSQDVNRVAFTSNRSGNFDIYVTDLDGAPVTRLTTDSATDSAARWSPDGQRLVFQSNRSGNVDVWVMNADGSGQYRLTTNPDYDGEPTWSPDGSRIAFISRRTALASDYALFVMNADGSDQQLLASRPYSSRPAWSGFGDRILFDSANPDGFQRPTYFSVATGQVSFYDYSEHNSDLQAGAWSVRAGHYVTRVTYQFLNGAWYVVAFRPFHFEDAGSGAYVLGSNVDAFPSWASVDRTPPVTLGTSTLSSIQPISRHRVYGAAQDAQTEVGLFDVQGRTVPGGEWMSLEHGYCLTIQDEPSGSGYCNIWSPPAPVMEYRVRAIDVMGNVEPWPDDPAKWTRVSSYASVLFGLVTDVRGHPLAGVTVEATNSLEGQTTTGADGRYQIHLLTESAFTVTARNLTDSSRQAYSYLYRNRDGNFEVDFTLQPQTGVLANGSFEIDLTGWTTGGDLPVEAKITTARDGDRSAVMGVTVQPDGSGWPGAQDPLGLDAFRVGTRGGLAANALTATAWLRQTVELPADWTRPTLSFAYINPIPMSVEPLLIVTVTDVVAPANTARFEYQRRQSWTPIWIDLEPWVGKTVTLQIEAQLVRLNEYEAFQPYLLDDVAIVPETTPLLSSISLTQVTDLPTELTINGTAFTQHSTVTIGERPLPARFVDATTLEVTLPAGLAPGYHAVRVADPNGFVTGSADDLLVGTMLPVPMVLRHLPFVIVDFE